MGISSGLGGGGLLPGLVLVKSQTVGSSVSSVTVSDCFNSSYDNYRVTLNGTDFSVVDTTLFVRPGNDQTAGSYYGGGYFVLFTGAGNGFSANNAQTNGIPVGITSTDQSLAFDVFQPNKTEWTKAIGSGSVGDFYVAQYQGVHAVRTAYTSLTILPASGTMTGGTIRVYGYRN